MTRDSLTVSPAHVERRVIDAIAGPQSARITQLAADGVARIGAVFT